MKIALRYRKPARRVYYGAVFEAKKEIPDTPFPLLGAERKAHQNRPRQHSALT